MRRRAEASSVSSRRSFKESNTNGTITNATWSQEAYRGQLVAETTNIVPLVVSLVSNDANNGALKGTAYATNPFPNSGSFSITGP